MSNNLITVLDYGVGNLASVGNMLRAAGAELKISSDPLDVVSADKLVLPGVGHFDHGMRMLNSSGLRDAIDHFALELRRPVLGICLGAQIMGLGSEEGKEPGLGWINMFCQKFPSIPGYRVPHMGWNQISCVKSSPLFDSMEDSARFYFVHSYYMHCIDESLTSSRTTHGIEFTCSIEKSNIFGVQFHPEKSLRHGAKFMREFVGLSAQ